MGGGGGGERIVHLVPPSKRNLKLHRATVNQSADSTSSDTPILNVQHLHLSIRVRAQTKSNYTAALWPREPI